MSKNIHYLGWNTGDTLRSYIKHAVGDTIRMWPFAKVYGLRYYWDSKYRARCRRSFQNRLNSVRYGNNWPQRRAFFIRNLYIRDGMGCNICRKIEPIMTIDHVVPLFAGGPNTLPNVQLLCDGCHKAKSKGENKRHTANNADREKALKSEAQKIKALHRKKARVGTVQNFNEKTLRRSVLYVREDWPKWRKLANRAFYTKRRVRGLPTLRPAEPATPVLQLQHKPWGQRGNVLPQHDEQGGEGVRGTVVPR